MATEGALLDQAQNTPELENAHQVVLLS